MLLRNSGGETIQVYCVLDRDYHSTAKVEKRLHEAEERGVLALEVVIEAFGDLIPVEGIAEPEHHASQIEPFFLA